jgi:uncharacterized protein
MTWQFSLTGLLIGLLVGITGMGGGSLMTPMLILIFGFKPTLAVGTDIFHGAIFKSFGAARHRQLGTVNLPLTLWMLVGSAPLSLVGVVVASALEHGYGKSWETTAKQILGVALLICGIGFLVKALVRPHIHVGTFQLARRDKVHAILIGAFGGFIVGLTSVGSGTFFGLAMMLLFPLGMAQLVGTDIVHAAALLWVAGFGHIIAGNVDFHATAWLLVGSIPGVLIGSQFTVRARDDLLRIALATVLFLSGVKLINFAGSDYVVVGVAVLAAAVIVFVLGMRGVRKVASARAATRLPDEAGEVAGS